MAVEPQKVFLYMTDEPSTTFHRWPDLSTELKLEVLCQRLMLAEGNDISWLTRRRLGMTASKRHYLYRFIQKNVSPILQTYNSELVTLARDVLYSKNRFRMSVRHVFPGQLELGGLRPHLVRNLQVSISNCSIPVTADDTLFRDCEAWPYILCFKDGYDDVELMNSHEGMFTGNTGWEGRVHICSTDTSWQKSFTNLQELTILVDIFGNHMPGGPEHCCIEPAMLERLQRLLVRTRMDFQAQRVNIKVTMRLGRKRACVRHDDLFADLQRGATRDGSQDVEVHDRA